MDKNTITGLILIFVIFIGFSIYNNSKTNKAFEKALTVAEASYARGEYETARAEYVNALKYKPNQAEVIAKINELNLKLGIQPDAQKVDTTKSSVTKSDLAIPASTNAQLDAGQYGVFSKAAVGDNQFITLENNKVELKISLKGGKVYSARLKDYRTYDSLPLFS